MSDFIHKDYIDYFEQLAINCQLLNHSPSHKAFVQTNGEEYASLMKSGLKYPALILEEIDTQIIGENFENCHYQINGSFLVVSNLASKGDFNARIVEQDKCMYIGHQIIAKMFYDRMNGQGFIKGFDWRSIKSSPIGRILDNGYGYLFEFTFNVKADQYFEIDSTVWP